MRGRWTRGDRPAVPARTASWAASRSLVRPLIVTPSLASSHRPICRLKRVWSRSTRGPPARTVRYGALQRAGERAPFVPEELAFDEPGSHRAAVQLDHGAFPPRTQRADRSGNELLPRAGLAREEDGRVRGRHAPHRFDQLAQDPVPPHNILKAGGGAPRPHRQGGVRPRRRQST
jgi:hypothetical protein